MAPIGRIAFLILGSPFSVNLLFANPLVASGADSGLPNFSSGLKQVLCQPQHAPDFKYLNRLQCSPGGPFNQNEAQHHSM
jgi:hypothetical protein